MANLNQGKIGVSVLAIALTLSVVAAHASAHTRKRAHATKKTHLRRSSVGRSRRTSRLRSRYRAFRGRLRLTHTQSRLRAAHKGYRSKRRYTRWAPAAEISPQRAEQIQEALVQAGDLHETPTGRWDTQTREAMREYQSSNGFQPTGLPDARSLMKLGLGPHPLPADADPKIAAQRSPLSFPQVKAVANAAQ